MSSTGSRGRISQLGLIFLCLELLKNFIYLDKHDFTNSESFFGLEVIYWQQFSVHPPQNSPKVVICSRICCVIACFFLFPFRIQSPPDRIGFLGFQSHPHGQGFWVKSWSKEIAGWWFQIHTENVVPLGGTLAV